MHSYLQADHDFNEDAHLEPINNYKLTIKMSDEALKKLKDANLNLCLIKSIGCSKPLRDLLPTIWISTPDFENENVITWSYTHESYEAYVSTSKRDEVIIPSSSYPIGFKETFTFVEDGDKICVEKRKTIYSVKDALHFWNDTSSDLTVGLLQNITFNGKELGPTPITVQTLKKYDDKNLYLPRRVLLTFVPPTIKAGQVVMKHCTYPATTITFGPGSIEREIFWAVRSNKGELIEPGAWHTPEHNGWDVPVSKICNLHNLLSKDDSDPTKRS